MLHMWKLQYSLKCFQCIILPHKLHLLTFTITDCRWREWMYSTLSTLNTRTEVPLSKAPNPQLLPGRHSINGCPLLRVCVHCCVCALRMGQMQSTNSEYVSPYLVVCHVTFTEAGQLEHKKFNFSVCVHILGWNLGIAHFLISVSDLPAYIFFSLPQL